LRLIGYSVIQSASSITCVWLATPSFSLSSLQSLPSLTDRRVESFLDFVCWWRSPHHPLTLRFLVVSQSALAGHAPLLALRPAQIERTP